MSRIGSGEPEVMNQVMAVPGMGHGMTSVRMYAVEAFVLNGDMLDIFEMSSGIKVSLTICEKAGSTAADATRTSVS